MPSRSWSRTTRLADSLHVRRAPRQLVSSVRPEPGHNIALRNSSGVSEEIHHPVVQSGGEFSYIRIVG